MTVAELLRAAAIDPLDAEVLLTHVLNQDRSWLLAHGEEEIGHATCGTFTAFTKRRACGEPVAYLTGEREFYGRMFRVTPAVLIPRPATETLVNVTLEILRGERKSRKGLDGVRPADTGISVLTHIFEHKICSAYPVRSVVDVGTGSGCIAVTLCLEEEALSLLGTDISASALEVARENARLFSVADRCTFIRAESFPSDAILHDCSHSLKNMSIPGFLLVSNPPYIPEGSPVDPGTRFEPRGALFAGPEGLDVLLPLTRSAAANPSCMGMVLECREEQVAPLLHILAAEAERYSN